MSDRDWQADAERLLAENKRLKADLDRRIGGTDPDPISYCEGCSVEVRAGERLCFLCGAEALP